MYLRTLYIIFCLVLLSLSGTSQVNYFNKQYDYNNKLEGLAAVTSTLDSGYLSVGFSVEGASYYGLYAVKTDKFGDSIWQKRLKTDSTESSATSVISLTDSSYIIGGTYIELDNTGLIRTNRDMYLVKLNSIGDTVWTKRFGLGIGTTTSPDQEACNKVIQTSDGGFALFGYSSNFLNSKWKMYLVKTDSNGNKEWEQSYGGNSTHDGGLDLIQVSDGGYYLLGWTDNFGIGTRNWYLVRTDVSGNELWYETYGTTEYNVPGNIFPALGGGYFICGGMYITATNNQGALIKIDTLGNIIWEKKHGYSFEDSFAKAIQLVDSSIVAVGNTQSFTPNNNGWVFKMDKNGDEIWDRVYVNSSTPNKEDYFYGMEQTLDGGFIFCGQTKDTMPNYQDGWLVKTDCFGCDSTLCYFPDSICPETTVGVVEYYLAPNNNELLVYPNPTTGLLHLNLNAYYGNIVDLYLYNIIGEKVLSSSVNQTKSTIHLNQLPNGTYFLKMLFEDGNHLVKKVILQK